MHYRIGFSSKKESASVYIECSVRKPGVNHPVREIVKRLGKKKDLLEKDPNALEKIQLEVDEMNRGVQGRKIVSTPATLENLNSELAELMQNQSLMKDARFDNRCAGYLILKSIYDELNLDYKLNYISKDAAFKYDLAKITKDLVLLRVLNPASKLRSSVHGPAEYLGFSSDNVNHIYKSLDVLCRNKSAIVDYVNKQFGKQVPTRNTAVCLYDITTYAFESTDQDALRDFGYSKDKKFNEVQVVMALATDQQGLPLDYSLFKGNQAEAATMVPFISELKKKFKVSNFTVVADRGLNSKANIDALVKLGNNYVLSSKIRGASEDIKAQVLDPEGRKPLIRTGSDGEVIEEGWYKELHVTEPILYRYPNYVFEQNDEKKLEDLENQLNHKTTKSAKNVKSTIKRRYIITWTPSRAAKDRKDRDRLIRKANLLIAYPSNIKANFKRGGRSFVIVDMQLETARLDSNLIEEQEQFDGIHVVETSLDSPAQEVLAIYGNLWRIENSFRNLKSSLQARPVYVRLPEHVRGHFLTCYLALCISRYLEHKLNEAGKHRTPDEIVHSLNSARIALINPTPKVEFYGTSGFNETVADIMSVVGLTVPDTFEQPSTLRRKLKVFAAMRDLFTSTTKKIKKRNPRNIDNTGFKVFL